jgi:hypothetical protein
MRDDPRSAEVLTSSAFCLLTSAFADRGYQPCPRAAIGQMASTFPPRTHTRLS